MNPAEPWTNRWTELKALGGGGQGDTVLVYELANPTYRAVLKKLRAGKETDPKARRRMFQEVSNLRVLHGAGAKVPKVLDDNTTNFEGTEKLFFVMEFIEGKTLFETITANCLELETAINLVLSLCETFRYAFKEGIIHRDIKPENIIVKSLSPPEAIMVDFGIAHNETDNSNLTEVGETFDNKFISLPERRGPDENKRDPRSDLTGLCAILLYCLTKCVPRDLRDSSNRPPHRWNSSNLENVKMSETQRTLLNAFFDRGFSWELDARFQSLDQFMPRLSEVLKPNASVLMEDLATVAARESALLRKSDRISQLSDFKQPVQSLKREWEAFIIEIQTKLLNSRFYVHPSNYQPKGVLGDFGDNFESIFLQMGVHNHQITRVIAYHFCSIGEDCSIVRQLNREVRSSAIVREPVFVTMETVAITRYTGDTSPPLNIIKADVEATIGRLMRELRTELVDQKIKTSN